MITTGMFRRQVWMTDDDEFDHILENLQRVLKLNAQYENHPSVEEFTKECSVMFLYGPYVLEREADAKFSLGEIWNLLQESPLPNNGSKFCRQIINCTRACNYIQKTSDSPLSIEIIKQALKIMMHKEKYRDGKDVLVGEYRKSPAFTGYHIFALADFIETYMKDVIFIFYESKKDDAIMAATNLFGNIINIHPFEDGNGRICRLILGHVLVQMKRCLFPVILSSFHRRGRRHYISAVKMFDRKPSMLYTMIVKSLIHCWDNFEQNAKILN